MRLVRLEVISHPLSPGGRGLACRQAGVRGKNIGDHPHLNPPPSRGRRIKMPRGLPQADLLRRRTPKNVGYHAQSLLDLSHLIRSLILSRISSRALLNSLSTSSSVPTAPTGSSTGVWNLLIPPGVAGHDVSA